MRNLIVVVFVEAVTEEMEFPRDNWPLHITLVKFDVAPTAGAGGAFSRGPGGPGPLRAGNDPLAAWIADLMDGPVSAALGGRVSVGADAGFGRAGSIPVSLVNPDPVLQNLHDALVRIVAGLPGRISTPGYTGTGYRPHVSHHGGRRLRRGDAVTLDRVALVDMAPDGSHAFRRVLRLWTL